MMLARVSNDVAGAPIVRCAVVEKCTFSSSGSMRRGFGLGSISRDLFDDKAFSINDLCAEGMACLSLFRTERKEFHVEL